MFESARKEFLSKVDSLVIKDESELELKINLFFMTLSFCALTISFFLY